SASVIRRCAVSALFSITPFARRLFAVAGSPLASRSVHDTRSGHFLSAASFKHSILTSSAEFVALVFGFVAVCVSLPLPPPVFVPGTCVSLPLPPPVFVVGFVATCVSLPLPPPPEFVLVVGFVVGFVATCVSLPLPPPPLFSEPPVPEPEPPLVPL